MQSHKISLFGQKVAILLDSPDWSDPHIYMRFLKKKEDNTWEKPSAKEGKVIKINLLEAIAIRDLCNSNGGKWSTVHVFGEEKTSISMEKEGQNLKLNIPGYSKFIQYPEAVLFGELMTHIVAEKIQNATGGSQAPMKIEENETTPQPTPNIQKGSSKNTAPLQSNPSSTPPAQPMNKNNIPIEKIQPTTPPPKKEVFEIEGGPVEYPFDDEDLTTSPAITPEAWMEALQKNDEYCLIPGQITAQRPKAVAFQINGKNQIWIPISTIQNIDQAPAINGVWVKQWWLEKNLDKIGSV